MTTLFISDLHLDAERPAVTELFGDTPVTLVGQGFGGSVALACAAPSRGQGPPDSDSG